jgi:hypothetical protein
MTVECPKCSENVEVGFGPPVPEVPATLFTLADLEAAKS